MDYYKNRDAHLPFIIVHSVHLAGNVREELQGCSECTAKSIDIHAFRYKMHILHLVLMSATWDINMGLRT